MRTMRLVEFSLLLRKLPTLLMALWSLKLFVLAVRKIPNKQIKKEKLKAHPL